MHVGLGAMALIGLTAGCSQHVQSRAVEAVARHLQPANSTLAGKLESSPNPKGEGVLVFVRAESGCPPRYAWIWVGNERSVYALDSGSRLLTPEFGELNQASPQMLQRVGSSGSGLSAAVEQVACQSAKVGSI